MSTALDTRRSRIALVRGAIGIAIVLAIWEAFARSGMFSKAITPPLGVIFRTLFGMLADGTLFKHAGATLLRLAAGMAIACAVAVPLALLMGRYRTVERALRPLLAVIMPIPSLAWVPLVVLWFGIGDLSTVLVVVYAASFPLLYNVWAGVRALNPLWVRSAITMNASEIQLFRYVILPAALPYAITGIRLAFGRAWIAVIGGELLASPEWGLGKLIFDAKEFLNADVMLATLFFIGVLGIVFERVVFKRLEANTVGRWGMTATGRR
jgi:NitT/TauT family transport system permease protein